MFWTYHPPPTHETHKAPFRPIPVCVQAQQKHRRRNTHSFAQCIYSSWKSRFVCPNSVHRLFFCLQYHTTTPHGKQISKKSTLTETDPLDYRLSCQSFSNSSSPSCTLVFLLCFHQLSTRHCPVSYSFYTLYKCYTNDCMHRQWHNTNHKILWRFCSGGSFQLRFCLFCWS